MEKCYKSPSHKFHKYLENILLSILLYLYLHNQLFLGCFKFTYNFTSHEQLRIFNRFDFIHQWESFCEFHFV